uniref:non-specific serine/threonine protein kinase n=1 Tax=Oryza sativa subsp. japonica TaxID=39947 RepID=Q2R0Z4_ORYSJ|nr:Leucine Rich Repeat family protein, expressed [Oryza sativa Japonica Group]
MNSLTGELPETISSCSLLEIVDLFSNSIESEIPPSIGQCSFLQQIILGTNNIRGNIPPDIGLLSNLSALFIPHNQLTGTIPQLLGSNKPLIWVNLQNNSLSGEIPPSLFNSTTTSYIDLSSNGLSGSIPPFSQALSSLRYLSLTENLLSGKIPITLGNIPSLSTLMLSGNKLDGTIPKSLSNLSKLQILDLSHNNLSGIVPPGLYTISSLTYLNFGANRLVGILPTNIGYTLPGLTSIIFEGSLSDLTYLDLGGNKLEAGDWSFMSSLTNCTQLTNLWLDRNKLQGIIPSSITNLSEGLKIPTSLGECLELESVHLEGNFLQGSIPGSFANLKGINEMDLSRNNLSGEIPDFFEYFGSLHTLNLSFNNLEGPVPRGGVFANSSNVFVQGNKKLCAISPMLQLPLCKELSSKRNKTSYNLSVGIPITSIVIVTLACVAIILQKNRTGRKKIIINDSIRHFNKLSYNDLYNATNGFSSRNLVVWYLAVPVPGGTNCWTVKILIKGQLKFGACNVAIKVFRLDQNGAPKNFFAECEALKNIRHRNLIRVINLCSTFDPSGNEYKALILEYRINGNLESWIHPKVLGRNPTKHLSLGLRIRIAVDIAVALDYLHNRCSPPMVHCDLKPSNVLLDDEMVACLSDFGLTKFLHNNIISLNNSSSTAGLRGSIGYIAPEYGLGCKVSTEGDVYSYGIIVLEMITGKCPTDEMFKDGMNLRSLVESAFPHKINDILEPTITEHHDGEDSNHVVPEILTCAIQLAKLGLMCTETSPKDRPTINDVYYQIISIKEKYHALINH